MSNRTRREGKSIRAVDPRFIELNLAYSKAFHGRAVDQDIFANLRRLKRSKFPVVIFHLSRTPEGYHYAYGRQNYAHGHQNPANEHYGQPNQRAYRHRRLTHFFFFLGSLAFFRAASAFFFDLTLPPLRPRIAASSLILIETVPSRVFFMAHILANRLANCQ